MKHRLRTQAKWTWGNRHRTQSLTFLSLSILYSLKFLWFFSQNILKAGMQCFKIGLLLSHDHRKPSCWWADSIYFLRGASESGRKVNESWNPVWKHICMQCAWVENLKLWPMRPLMERERDCIYLKSQVFWDCDAATALRNHTQRPWHKNHHHSLAS